MSIKVEVELEIDEGVLPPIYTTKKSTSFPILIKSFKKLFKGDREVPLDKKLQKSIKEGYITLRGFERLLVGTGIKIKVPPGYQVQLRTTNANALKTGLVVANSPQVIDHDYTGEVGVILLNNSPFLSEVRLGAVVANATLVKIEQLEWEVEW